MTDGVKVRVESFGRVLVEAWFPRVPTRDEELLIGDDLWLVRRVTWFVDGDDVTAQVEVKEG